MSQRMCCIFHLQELFNNVINFMQYDNKNYESQLEITGKILYTSRLVTKC